MSREGWYEKNKGGIKERTAASGRVGRRSGAWNPTGGSQL